MIGQILIIGLVCLLIGLVIGWLLSKEEIKRLTAYLDRLLELTSFFSFEGKSMNEKDNRLWYEKQYEFGWLRAKLMEWGYLGGAE